MLNHSSGIKINNRIISVNIEIVKLKELDRVIFFILIVIFITKEYFINLNINHITVNKICFNTNFI